MAYRYEPDVHRSVGTPGLSRDALSLHLMAVRIHRFPPVGRVPTLTAVPRARHILSADHRAPFPAPCWQCRETALTERPRTFTGLAGHDSHAIGFPSAPIRHSDVLMVHGRNLERNVLQMLSRNRRASIVRIQGVLSEPGNVMDMSPDVTGFGMFAAPSDAVSSLAHAPPARPARWLSAASRDD